MENRQINSYLVTGCAGFIGWKVSELLLSEGHIVVGVDNLNDAYDIRLKHWRLNQIKNYPNFQFYQLDIVDRKSLRTLFNKKFDAIINLAARAGVRQSVGDPWTYYETNVIGTLNLLELCRERGIKKFVLASTSSLYGANNSRPFREDANTDGPLSPYAASKKAAEVLCYTYHYLYGIDVTVLRYFTVYGPAGRPDMSIFRFVRWIIEGEAVVLYGDGSQERDFTYVDDIARGTLQALQPVGYEVINLGSDRPVSIRKILSILQNLLERNIRIIQKPTHLADMPATWADITKARTLLAWEPRISLEEGLRRTVEWYIEHRGWAKEISL